MINGIGYTKLLKAVEHDEETAPRSHDYRKKMQWALDRATHYAEKTGLSAEAILDAWEEQRDYWYMNWYQESNQPSIAEDKVRVFETKDELLKSVGERKFICPACNEISTNPYTCNSGKPMSKDKICDWKVFGLFGDLGKGISVFVKSEMRLDRIFMPVAWRKSNA